MVGLGFGGSGQFELAPGVFLQGSADFTSDPGYQWKSLYRDDVKTVADTYLNGGYASDDATEYDGALVDVVPRAGVCPTCRRPTGRAVVRELRAVRA